MKFKLFNQNLDLDSRQKLFNECFPEHASSINSTKEHYEWKFHSLNGPKSYEFAVYLKDEIIAYYSAIHLNYIINKKICKIGLVCDVMTGIKSRGKGVFTKLGLFSTDYLEKQNFSFTTGYPIRPEVIPGHLNAGWNKLFELPIYFKLVRLNNLFKKFHIGFISSFFNILIQTFDYFSFKSIKQTKYKKFFFKDYEIDEIYGLDSFYKKASKESKISLEKNIKLINWRLNAPEKKYFIIVIRDNFNEIVGYSIFTKVIKNSIPCIAIIDIICIKDMTNVTKIITNEISNYARENSCDLIMIMCNKRLYKEYSMIRSTFFKTHLKFWFILKGFKKDLSKILYDQSNWHITWLHSDNL